VPRRGGRIGSGGRPRGKRFKSTVTIAFPNEDFSTDRLDGEIKSPQGPLREKSCDDDPS
jgi:hypothetical protein